ncbi:MAG: alpha-amylase, partial [Prevotella sp.]|nr:alpha-amylase [Prevotella sp.]
EEIDNEQLNSLLTTIKNQGDEIEMKDKEIVRLKSKLEKMEPVEKKPAEKKSAAKKATPAKKTPVKKAAAKKD